MPHAAMSTTLQTPPPAGSRTPPQRPVTRTAAGPRGCGVARTQGDIYLEFALHLAGAQGIGACLVDPPLPFDQRLWGVPSIGVRTFPDAQGVNSAASQVNTAKISLETAKRELDREEGLFKQGVVAEWTRAIAPAGALATPLASACVFLDLRKYELSKIDARLSL